MSRRACAADIAQSRSASTVLQSGEGTTVPLGGELILRMEVASTFESKVARREHLG